MPDPQVVYVVTGIVVLGLVAWVIVVLTRAEKPSPGPTLTSAADRPETTAESKK
jgi:hypothetical protein